MTAIIEGYGVGSRVLIAAKSVAMICTNSFCSAAIVCFRLVRGASATVYDQMEILHEWLEMLKAWQYHLAVSDDVKKGKKA